jgi:hypothetical protein
VPSPRWARTCSAERLVSKHLLRYASPYDWLADPQTIQRDHVLRNVNAMTRLRAWIQWTPSRKVTPAMRESVECRRNNKSDSIVRQSSRTKPSALWTNEESGR